MPFRYRRRIKVAPGIYWNIGKRGVTSTTIGHTTFRKGYEPRTSIRLFRGLSWIFGGRRKR